VSSILIKQAKIVNEGKISTGDVLIKSGKIDKIGIQLSEEVDRVIDAKGLYLLPGLIDDQVHFREPGLTNKGTIATESKAAVAGGITSFMEMPNVKPATTSIKILENKYELASKVSWANFSFYLGATNDNLEEVKALDPNKNCGVKIFMGASTGNMLVNNEKILADIFTHSPTLITTHCEDTPMIVEAEKKYRQEYGEDVPMSSHPEIRSRQACYKSSSFAVNLAKKTGANLHVLHITTAEEMALFDADKSLEEKKITAEACVHHLWFSEEDYASKDTLIKCNPAIKKKSDRAAIRKAVNKGQIDIIATDHAPHTWQEKRNKYFSAPAGLPLVQRSLLALLDMVHEGVFDLETVVQKTSHNVAIRYQIPDRGYIREGYFADLVLVDMEQTYTDNKDDILYKCGWSPWEGHTFKSTIKSTIINGYLVYHNKQFSAFKPGVRLAFNRN
jgi:dihydroorotase